MEQEKKVISVFIASPGDLFEERRVFRDTIENLNAGFGEGAGVKFDALGWEDTLASTGRRSQSAINSEIDKCDVFILVMYRRWGQAAPDAAPYSSYTEEEFHRALELWNKNKKPEIFVFFKRVDESEEYDPGPQLQKVINFRKHLEETKRVLYRYFDDSRSFASEVNLHLRAYAKGEHFVSVEQNKSDELPIETLEMLEMAKVQVMHRFDSMQVAKKNPLKKIFVSYSHKDKEWLDEIKVMLKPIIRDDKLLLWDDSKITTGRCWKEEINKAINESQVAVLLVSKYFLESDFIANNELPPLLTAAKERVVKIVWVCISYCLWHYTEIKEYQAAYSPSQPLNGLVEHEKDRLLVHICEEILRASNSDFKVS